MSKNLLCKILGHKERDIPVYYQKEDGECFAVEHHIKCDRCNEGLREWIRKNPKYAEIKIFKEYKGEIIIE